LLEYALRIICASGDVVQQMVLKRTDQVLPHYVVHLKPRPNPYSQFSALAFAQAPLYPAIVTASILKQPVTAAAAALQQTQVRPLSTNSKSKGGAGAVASKRGRR
jgi:hypothetical protein